jgi:hypothetical protein
MSTANSARNRKPAALKVVSANTDQGAVDPVELEILSALQGQALDISKLFGVIDRLNASGTSSNDGDDGVNGDLDVDVVCEIGETMLLKLADALDLLQMGLRGNPDRLAEAAKVAGVSRSDAAPAL